jgi:pimeloyl-ACP methyl ester carboxylesterase
MGQGPEFFLLFHGFGQTHQDLLPLMQVLSKRGTVFAFDLFYHGESFWHNRERPLSWKDWQELMEAFFLAYPSEHYEVWGYSMGAKFAIGTAFYFPEKMKALHLLAADGLYRFWLYRAVTEIGLLRRIFRSVIVNPRPYYFVLNVFDLFRLLPKSVLKFSETQMRTRTMRRRVYFSWVQFRKLYVPLNALVVCLRQHQVTVFGYSGAHDAVISERQTSDFRKAMPEGHWQVYKCGHNQLPLHVALSLENGKQD